LQALTDFDLVGTDTDMILDALNAEAASRSGGSIHFAEDFTHRRHPAPRSPHWEWSPLRG